MFLELKKFFSYNYLNLFIQGKLPFLRKKEVKISEMKFTYPYWPHFYGIFYEIFVEKIYEIKNLSTVKTIIDAGANIGLAAAFFSKEYPKAKIFCFEPNPEALKFLEKNIKANNINAQVYPYALGDENKQMPIFVDSFINGSSSAGLYNLLGEKKRPTSTIQIEVKKLSNYINEVIDILKLDIEGGEWEVLDDLIKNNKLKYISNLLIEFHYHPIFLARPISEFLKLLDQNGFFYYVSRRQNELMPKKILHSYYIFAFKDE